MLAKLSSIVEVGTRSLRIAHEAGVRMAYGTDLLGELHDHQSEEFLIRAEALPALEVLRSATISRRLVLRMEGKLGVIAPGALPTWWSSTAIRSTISACCRSRASTCLASSRRALVKNTLLRETDRRR